ncbi:hypothetical protein [Altererythrobacter lutimaris]|uniref:Uncharacterized protein n=1 Tax=Altererythrobacter lutimaris TaxID=2743979 RepID=A0A850H803_9SPHN|nr:hypothetical protein [Altererythrobacter lutimaris]NVE95297.1 hypothetical protein [Altererythrobacter lutimaris]
MQMIRSEVTRLFAIGFIAGSLMVGAATATDWDQELAPQAFAAEQEVVETSAQ